MPTAARRFLPFLCTLVILLLVGSPGFPALDRAVAKVFVPVSDWLGLSPIVPSAGATPALNLPPSPESLPSADVGRADLQVRPSTQPATASESQRSARGVLVPLYISFAALQGLDVHSTLTALDRGGVERNPLMAGLASRPAAFVAAKAGASAGIIYLTEHVRPHSRVAAIAMMAAFNSVYAMVVAHNYRVAMR